MPHHSSAVALNQSIYKGYKNILYIKRGGKNG